MQGETTAPVTTTQTGWPSIEKLEIATVIDMMASNDIISDLHISGWDYIAYRINGDIVKQTQLGIISNEFM
jgi:hypothetical protein